MPHLIGPDFIGLQASDLTAAGAFYGDLLGLPVMNRTPDAIIFASKPIPFAVRTPLVDLSAAEGHLGWGVGVWFATDDADALHDKLKAADVPIVMPTRDGPFGRHFMFRDPFGYTITAHQSAERARSAPN